MYAMWILVSKGENPMAMSEDGYEKTLARARWAISSSPLTVYDL